MSQALADFCKELLLVLSHPLDKRLIFGFLVGGCPKDHFGENRGEIDSLRRELVNQLTPIGWVAFGNDDSMSLQLPQAICQDIRRDSFVGAQEFFEGPGAQEHHVADDQERPAIAQHLDGSIQGAARAAFGLALVRHNSILA